MFNDLLPDHLRDLNTISTSPPSSAMNQETETALWEYLNNVDELWPNFGVAPSATPKEDGDKLAVKEEGAGRVAQPFDLASFVMKFGNDVTPSAAKDFAVPIPFPYSADVDTPAGINTAEIMPATAWSSPNDDRISGAKKLKRLGAGHAEIEEESKRRRNTEASARFRAKKKEKEQALERHAKDLEAVLAQLNAENASLKNENKLLKAIVLGAGNREGADGLQAALAAFGAERSQAGKRKRDEASR